MAVTEGFQIPLHKEVSNFLDQINVPISLDDKEHGYFTFEVELEVKAANDGLGSYDYGSCTYSDDGEDYVDGFDLHVYPTGAELLTEEKSKQLEEFIYSQDDTIKGKFYRMAKEDLKNLS